MFSFKLMFVIFFVYESSGMVLKTPPPNSDEVAKTARRILHNAEWVSVATISTTKGIEGYPFVSVESVSDGPAGNSTGIPYFYVTNYDPTVIDLLANSKCSIMATLAQSDYCKKQKYDPEDPRCAKLILTGNIILVDKESVEHTFAQSGLFQSHPGMKSWPPSHGFHIVKLDIQKISLFNGFGGLKNISTVDYFNSNISSSDNTTQSQ